ncbi:hypothetical protein EKH83_18170 [Arcticibacter tournemirensis]|uniref:DUF5977 domain-containing protein n=1 Tax=Arcticibacter tournemirensis TaxID=699437 RepID=A0A4V1KHM9_9SPHI|nr:hypothetical protein EKH83_18170 [Arcticibacter tournemirensis]
MPQYLQDGKVKINTASSTTTIQYKVSFVGYSDSYPIKVKPYSIKVMLVAGNALYVSQAQTVNETAFPSGSNVVTLTFTGTITNSHLTAGSKITLFVLDAKYGSEPVAAFTGGSAYYDWVAGALFYNDQMSRTLAKNSCEEGYAGSNVTYTVAANKHSGATKAEANAKAEADLNANAQNYANANGTCTPTCTGPAVVWLESFNNKFYGAGYKGKTIVIVNDVPAATYRWYVDGGFKTTTPDNAASFSWLPSETHYIEVEVVTPCGTSGKLRINYPSGTTGDGSGGGGGGGVILPD